MQGKGIYTYSDGRVHKGEWFNNKMHGFGVYKWPEGGVSKIYKGEFKNDK